MSKSLCTKFIQFTGCLIWASIMSIYKPKKRTIFLGQKIVKKTLYYWDSRSVAVWKGVPLHALLTDVCFLVYIKIKTVGTWLLQMGPLSQMNDYEKDITKSQGFPGKLIDMARLITFLGDEWKTERKMFFSGLFTSNIRLHGNKFHVIKSTGYSNSRKASTYFNCQRMSKLHQWFFWFSIYVRLLSLPQIGKMVFRAIGTLMDYCIYRSKQNIITLLKVIEKMRL